MSDQQDSADQVHGADASDEALEVAGRPRLLSSRRSPIISLAVVIIGVYLLVAMSADTRYWLQSEDPVPLGDAATFVQSGGLSKELAERFVVIEGTPDARTAARYKLGDRQVQLLRVVEGGGSLFAAVPRSADTPSDQYAGRYEGRMRRLSSTRMLPWIEQYYADLKVTETHEVEPSALNGGLASSQVKTKSGALVRLAPDDRVSLTVKLDEVRVQLGRKSFKRLDQARAAMEALGVPFREPESQDNAKFYQFWATIPDAQRKTAQAQLNANVEQSDGPKAAYGAVVLPGSATYWVPVSELQADGSTFTFAERPGMPEVSGTAVTKNNGMISTPVGNVRSAYIEKPLVVDPTGYIINVDERPSSHRVAPLLWLAALLVVLLNLTSMVLYWRRRS